MGYGVKIKPKPMKGAPSVTIHDDGQMAKASQSVYVFFQVTSRFDAYVLHVWLAVSS